MVSALTRVQSPKNETTYALNGVRPIANNWDHYNTLDFSPFSRPRVRENPENPKNSISILFSILDLPPNRSHVRPLPNH